MAQPYVERLTDRLIADLLAVLPAVMIVGPRGSGKTTTARRHARDVVRLDRAAEAGPFRDDPDSVLARLEPPILLDEWQVVPEVLGAVKRAIDDRSGDGRFLLTGSVRAELLEPSWAMTGRVVTVTQWGLCQRELHRRAGQPSFFDVVFDGGVEQIQAPADPPDLPAYVDLALTGGFPEVALRSSELGRRRWLQSYVSQLVMRDAGLHQEDRDPVKLRRYLVAVAANTAGVVEHKTLYDAASVSRMTGSAYDSLLDLLFLTERIPAWHSNRMNRLTRTPKRYLIDPALLGPLLGASTRSVLRNADLLGRVIDTFVVGQLRPEREVSEVAPTLYHLRQDSGRHEVDLVVEAPDGRVAGLEIKSAAAPKPDDAKHLAWMRDELGDNFVCGILFHTGPRPFRLGERLYALPIAVLWAQPGSTAIAP